MTTSVSLARRLFFVALLGPAVGCSSADHPSSSADGLGNREGGAADARAGTEASAEGGEDAPSDAVPSTDDGNAGEGGVDGGQDGGDAGAVGADAGYPPPPTALCSQSASWSTGVLIPISTASDDEFDSVTPDELSIVWTAGTGSSATIEYADRGAATDAFSAPQALSAGQLTANRVTLSYDGLRMIVVDADGQGFSQLTRPSRAPPGNTFGAPTIGDFANLDAPGALQAGQSYGDPVLDADDSVFYYSVYGGASPATIFRTARLLLPGDTWPVGTALAASSSGLAAQGSLRRRPTGVSSDDQTLLFWDQVLGEERAAWIDESTGVFDVFVDLGSRTMAAPSSSCAHLYYSAQGTGSIDLFVATH